MSTHPLTQSIYLSLLDLFTEEGICASSKDEVYGCIFGRDSALTILKILRICSKGQEPAFFDREFLLSVCRRSLFTLVALQGKETNIESGEEPGKFIHEYRTEKFDHLLGLERPWFVYPEGVLKNYDSIDSTPLTLIAIYKYWQATQDGEFLMTVLSSVEAGLNWIITYGDKDKDFLLEYDFPSERHAGGLHVQSWTDSHESIRQNNGQLPYYPIAPVEVQGDAWLALKLWGDFYLEHSPKFGKKLLKHARQAKRMFNKLFVFKDEDFYFIAQALDGEKNQIKTVTGNPMLLLWSSYIKGGKVESILYKKYIPYIIARSFCSDMFDEEAGIRTMSTLSATFNPNQDSYHNGSFWPVLNTRIFEGLLNWGYFEYARRLREATLKPIEYFGSPIELYVRDENGRYLEYRSPSGQVSCRVQAWSAAGVLDLLLA